MEEYEEKRDKKNDSKEDDYLDKVWENWASRRRCEKRHVPEFIKKDKENKRTRL
jgi:hypothetical protein